LTDRLIHGRFRKDAGSAFGRFDPPRSVYCLADIAPPGNYVNNLTLLAAQVDLADPGELELFIDESQSCISRRGVLAARPACCLMTH